MVRVMIFCFFCHIIVSLQSYSQDAHASRGMSAIPRKKKRKKKESPTFSFYFPKEKKPPTLLFFSYFFFDWIWVKYSFGFSFSFLLVFFLSRFLLLSFINWGLPSSLYQLVAVIFFLWSFLFVSQGFCSSDEYLIALSTEYLGSWHVALHLFHI